MLQILETREERGWVDLFVAPLFASGGSKLALILPQTQGSAGDFRHVTMIDKSGLPTALTSGKFVVTELLAWDEAGGKM